jgi:hypothetical protein
MIGRYLYGTPVLLRDLPTTWPAYDKWASTEAGDAMLEHHYGEAG